MGIEKFKTNIVLNLSKGFYFLSETIERLSECGVTAHFFQPHRKEINHTERWGVEEGFTNMTLKVAEPSCMAVPLAVHIGIAD